MNYEQYVDSKRIEVKPSGFDPSDLNPVLFPFQRDVVRWAVRRGKAALFEDCGLGKSLQEWEFAQRVIEHTGKPALILAPLSVNKQMVKEAPEFGYSINNARSGADIKPGINVTNYEILHKFIPDDLGAIICDESSILKGGALGKMSNDLVAFAKEIPYRLAATATPAPNDLDELIFHAEFLGIMREAEIKALFFTQDGNSSNKFRLKRNAVEKFYSWMASWAVAMRRPSDLGYADTGFELPSLNIEQITVDIADPFSTGTLFGMEATGIAEQRAARKASLNERVQITFDIVNKSLERLCGKKNTQNDEKQNTTLILENESVDFRNQEAEKKTNSTCGNTTKKTESGIKNTAKDMPTKRTSSGVNDTLTILSTERNAKNLQEGEINTVGEMVDYLQNSESMHRNTMTCLPHKVEDAQSAKRNLATQDNTDCMLITTTLQGKSEGFFAHPVILESENSETIPNCCNEQLNILSAQSKPESWVIWCDLNEEQKALEAAFGDLAFSIYGSLSPDEKEKRLYAWLDGERPILISKLSIVGFGINMQQSHNMVFCGLGNSYEQYYQGIRRQWRFGQTQTVNVYVVVSTADGAVVANIHRKEQQAGEMFDNLVKHMAVHTDLGVATRHEMDYNPQQSIKIPQWMKQPVKTQTEPGMWWIDLDSIPYQWTEAPTFHCGVSVGNQIAIIPSWIQSI